MPGMAAAPRIVFHTGGPTFHPVDLQAREIASWLGGAREVRCEFQDGLPAFEHLDDCDVLIVMGLHGSGMTSDLFAGLCYHPLQQRHKDALERYVGSGRPIIAHHGGVASYDDWPRFGEI